MYQVHRALGESYDNIQHQNQAQQGEIVEQAKALKANELLLREQKEQLETAIHDILMDNQ